MISEALKRCSHCRIEKPLSAFRASKVEPSGKYRQCRDCEREYKRGAATRPITQETIDRFWEQVDKNGPIIREELGACWVWTGRLAWDRYGSFSRNGRMVVAHRFAYEVTYGPLGEGMWALHKCDNEPCCRPDHLFEGDAFDNMQDAARKGHNGMQRYPERSHFRKTKGLTLAV